ncbi:MAG TPA: MFS transporter [Burkholderiaceae bacterium]|nr:MFS transporter [Burkholderiaceae bacterium]
MTSHGLQMHGGDDYLIGKRGAWFAFAMTIGLMLVDYIDRQVIVSLFPYMKLEWALSDKQLGALVSVVSITVALGALPVALLADRYSRVKSIVVMATVWSLASISCMFTRNYSQMFVARAFVGLGEAGYGSVGAALIASIFPARMRSVLLAAFFAAASVGSVLGVMLGGLIAAKWGWKAAFGVVGLPGLVLALLYLKVRDYRTVALTPELDRATKSTGSTAKFIVQALVRSPTMLWVCLGGAAQLIVVSAVWSWLPSFLNRYHGVEPARAAVEAALVVMCGALGSLVWGSVADRMAQRRPRNKLLTITVLCLVALAVLLPTFGGTGSLAPSTQFALIALGGFMMTCTVGPVSAVVIDVVHPGVRATGASVLALFQNLFGLALGPFPRACCRMPSA